MGSLGVDIRTDTMETRVLDGAVATVDVEERRVDRDDSDTEEDEQSAAGERAAGIGHAARVSAASAAAGVHACAVQLLRQARKGLASGAVHVDYGLWRG